MNTTVLNCSRNFPRINIKVIILKVVILELSDGVIYSCKYIHILCTC